MSGAKRDGGLRVWGHLKIIINRLVTFRRELWVV